MPDTLCHLLPLAAITQQMEVCTIAISNWLSSGSAYEGIPLTGLQSELGPI